MKTLARLEERLPPAPWRGGPWSLLSIAGYVTWAAVTAAGVHWTAVLSGDWRQSAGLALLVLFLGAFFAQMRGSSRDSLDRRWRAALTIVEGAAAVSAASVLANGLPVVLTVIVAAQLFVNLPRARALAWTALLDAGLALCFVQWMDWRAVGLSLLEVFGFQAFAVLSALYGVSLERAGKALADANAQLATTRALLDESARSAERLKLSRELHDVAGHKLTALKLNLAVLARDARLAEREEVAVARRLAGELLDDIRNVVSELRKDDGIELRRAVEALTRQIPGTRFEIDIPPGVRVDSMEAAEVLLKCAQEGITNALRHGSPKTIAIQLRCCDGAFELRVKDDGRARPDIRFGNGLTGMRERLDALGGSLNVAPARGRGVELVANLPTGH